MSRETIVLKHPTSRTKDGPVIRLTPPNLSIKYDYPTDDGSVNWVELFFQDVLASEYRQEACCTAEDLDAYNKLLKEGTSAWLSEMESRWSKFLGSQVRGKEFLYFHWRLYFDDVGCINIIAKSCQVSESNHNFGA